MLTTIICLYGLCFNPAHVIRMDAEGEACVIYFTAGRHTRYWFDHKVKNITCEQLAAEINKELRK